MSVDVEKLRALLADVTPDWCVYSEPEVGLEPGLFSGSPMREGFGPIEPLQGHDLTLASLAPALDRDLIAAHEIVANLEADQAAKETAIGGLEFALEQAWASNVERDELIAKLRADIGARDRLLDDPVVNDIQDAAWNHARAALS